LTISFFKAIPEGIREDGAEPFRYLLCGLETGRARLLYDKEYELF
jgi:hypothetical protein